MGSPPVQQSIAACSCWRWRSAEHSRARAEAAGAPSFCVLLDHCPRRPHAAPEVPLRPRSVIDPLSREVHAHGNLRGDHLRHADAGTESWTATRPCVEERWAFAVAATAIAALFASWPSFPSTRALHEVWGQTRNAVVPANGHASGNDWIVAARSGRDADRLLATVRMRRRRAWMVAALLYLSSIRLRDVGAESRMPRRFFDPPPVAGTLRPNHDAYRVFHEADWYGQEEPARQYFQTASRLTGSCATDCSPYPAGAHTAPSSSGLR